MPLHWSKLKPYVLAFLIFLSSRVVMVVGILIGIRYLPRDPGHLTAWNAEGWYRNLLRYDSGWYLGIAARGYGYNGDDTVAQSPVFYPVYPLLARWLGVTGLTSAALLLLISNVAIVITIFLLFRFIKDKYGEAIALLSIALISFFPTSLFFSAGYTESLTLFFIVIFFLLLEQKRFLFAALTAGLASGTRSTGVILVLPLLVELWRANKTNIRSFLLKSAAYGTIATAGLWLFSFYLWFRFNSPLAFATNLHAWEFPRERNNIFRTLTLQPFYQHLGEIRYGPWPNNIDPWVFLAFIIILVAFRKRLTLSLWVYALSVLLLPYLTRTSGSLGFQSMMRYMLLAFPVFILLATLLKNRLWLAVVLNTFFAAFLLMYSAMFSQWYWVG